MSRYGWFVVVDDDTYVKVPQFIAALSSRGLDPQRAIAIGRKFFFPGKGSLLGGGPGVAISRGSLNRIKLIDCGKEVLHVMFSYFFIAFFLFVCVLFVNYF
jgi:hypothetical protein